MVAAIGMLEDRPVGERRLLLVEDNPADADLVAECLLDVGEETPLLVRAASLGEALELLEAEQPFTAILLDLNLPDSTGLETLDRVLERGPSAPVIVMTGGDAGDLGVLAVAHGAADFLPKDELTGRLLLRSVRYATERAHRRDVQAQYRALVENSRDLVSILERDLTIRYVSPSIRRVLGYRPEEREGTDVSVDIHPEDLDRVRAEVERLLADPGHTSHLQYRVKHKDGSWRSLDTIAQNCFDDPHIGGFVVSARDVTDLFAAQEEARATARRLERTVGALQDAVLTLELPSRSITDCNAATEAIFGYSAGEMLGRSTKLLHVDEESFLQLEAESLAALRDEGLFHVEARMRRKDGTVFPAEITISYVYSATGGGESVVKVVRDITERVDRLQRLRFQAALLQEVGQPVLAVDEEARLTYWNRAAEELTGFTWDDVKGTSIVDLIVIEEDRDAAIAGREMARGGGRWEGEIRIRTKDGGVATVQATATPGVNPDGSPGGRIAAGVDITGLRHAEEESRRAAERLRLQAELLEAVGQAVIATDLDDRIIYWNRAAEELYGWSREEALGRSALEVTPSEAKRERASEIFETLREGGTWTGTFEVRRRDGSTFHALVNDAPMYDEQGELVGVIGVSSDISDRITLEERLRQAAKMEAVGRLAAGVAHDFNNLLTAVEGHVSILLEEIAEDSELREDVEEIQIAGRRAATLTRQLLAFSRKQKLEERRLDLRSVALELETMLRRLVPERIDFRVEAGSDHLVVRADPGQLQQVVMNLVVNAVDAIEDAGNITLSVHETEVTPDEAEEIPWEFEPGAYARLTVRDTGAGMSPGVLSHVFEPFYTTKPEGEGTGLGLAMVYGIVKQSAGHIFADSEPGRGTTFEVLLPRVVGEAPVPTAQPAASLPSLEGAVVLLVEDDQAVRNVARRILSRAGCSVLEAANGKEALELADRHGGTVDVVLSDVVMPDMGGVELQKELRARHPDLRVVLASGYSETEVHGEIRELGAAFLAKPFTPDALLRSVAEALTKEP